MKRFFIMSKTVGGLTMAVALFLVTAISPAAAQTPTESVFNGHRIIIPASSIPQPGRHHTNYFFVDSDIPDANGPPSGVETPGSMACVYQLVTGPATAGCPVATSTNLPTGGWGAIAIVDAGDYPTAAADLAAFSSYYGIPAANLTVTWPGGKKKKPPVYSDWEVEEALDIEWAHAMAPQAKLFLVESVQVNTDPTWAAVTLAAKLVAKAGGGVVSMSWGDPEVKQEKNWDKFFTTPGVVYFAASGDSGIGVSIYPGASPNVVSVGGTYFNRDRSGKFVNEVYYTNGGGGNISPYEPIPSYQSGIAGIVGTHRGYPDVAADFCCAGIYLHGGWYSVGGTSWASPTFAGIVNAAGNKQPSTADELSWIYGELASPTEYKADFNDITQGDSSCMVGWDLCTGVGSPRTYVGK
jgi:subtilase family serine protease